MTRTKHGSYDGVYIPSARVVGTYRTGLVADLHGVVSGLIMHTMLTKQVSPAKPGALFCEPLKAASGGRYALRCAPEGARFTSDSADRLIDLHRSDAE